MEFSTPLANKGDKLRRRTLMKLVDSPIVAGTVNDETERSSRRSIIETQKKTQDVANTSLNDSVRFSGEQEIKDHLKICTKLFAENKITIGVAWQLKIIDLLKAVSRKEGSDSLQVASTSLDIGAKVYGLRVDDVHADALKLANSMARFAEKNQVQDQENGDLDENGEKKEEGPRSKRKKKTLRFDVGVKSTIVKDRSTLLAPIPQLESVVFSNRIDSTLSTVDNLFTNSFPLDKACYKLLALGEEKAWVAGPDEAVEGLEEPKNFDIDLLPKDGNICTPFLNFVLDRWNEEEEQNNAINKDYALDKDVVVFDDNGIPIHELDGPLPDDDFNDLATAEEDDEPPITEDYITQQIRREAAHTVDILRTDFTLQRSEYSYNGLITLGNGKVIDQIWAGPSHWKLKFVRRSKARYSAAIQAQTVSRPKKKKLKNKEPEPIDFTEVTNDVVDELMNMKRLKFKKKVLPVNKITLPLPDASNRKIMQNIHELMIKPGTIVTPAKNDSTRLEQEQTRIEQEQNNFENIGNMDNLENGEHDPNDGVMDDMDGGMDHNDDGDGFEKDGNTQFQEQNFMGDNLVDAPEYTAKTYIPYALQAKKMDMKKLKNFIWQMLSNNTMSSKDVQPTTFSRVFADSKTTLPQSMAKELSCSLAFSAVLHLCNEQNLKLTQLPGSKDFNIESG